MKAYKKHDYQPQKNDSFSEEPVDIHPVGDAIMQDRIFSNQRQMPWESFNPPEEFIVTFYHSECQKEFDVEETVKFLQIIKDFLNRSPSLKNGFCEFLNFVDSFGIEFPCILKTPNSQSESTSSINIVINNCEQQVDSLWAGICSHFFQYCLDQVNNRPTLGIFSVTHEYLKCLNSICHFYSSTSIWKSYCHFRQQKLDQCLRDVCSDSSDLCSFVNKFEKVANSILDLIDEDIAVYLYGTFPPSFLPFFLIHDLYLSPISETVSEIIDHITRRPSTIPQINKPVAQDLSIFERIKQWKNQWRNRSVNVVSGFHESVEKNSFSIYKSSIIKTIIIFHYIERHVLELNELSMETILDILKKKKISREEKGLYKSWYLHNFENTEFAQELSLGTEYKNDLECHKKVPNPINFKILRSDSHWLFHDLKDISNVDKKQMWEWRCLFKHFSSQLIKHIEQVLESTTMDIMDSMGDCCHSNIEIEICQDLREVHLLYPRFLAPSAKYLVDELDVLLPIVCLESEESTTLISKTLIDRIKMILLKYHDKLVKVYHDFPHNSSLKQLYHCLSIVSFIKCHLISYNKLTTQEIGRAAFQYQKSKFEELEVVLINRIRDYSSEIIQNIILKDKDSMEWNSNQPFRDEEEVSSYAVQMWYLHLKGVQKDLWNFCPPDKAQLIFGAIFKRGFIMLIENYLSVSPLEKRVTQFKVDTHSIFLITFNMLFPISFSLRELVSPQPHHCFHLTFHEELTKLLMYMAILICPLDDLQRFFLNDTPQKFVSGKNGLTENINTRFWLSYIHPELYKSLSSDITDEVAVELQLKLLKQQPVPSYAILLQALIMRNHMLLKALISWKALKQLSLNEDEADDKEDVLCERFFSDSECCCQMWEDYTIHMLDSLLWYILSLCNLTSSYSEKTTISINVRPASSSFSIPDDFVEEDFVTGNLSAIMKSYLLKAIDPSIQKIRGYNLQHYTTSSILKSIKKLPCGCAINCESIYAADDALFVIETIKDMITQMCDFILLMPVSLKVFFRCLLEQQYDEINKQNIFEVILDCLKQCLMSNVMVSEAGQKMLAELYTIIAFSFHSILKEDFAPKQSTDNLSKIFVNQNAEWLQQKVDEVTASLDVRNIHNLDIHISSNVEDFQKYVSIISKSIKGKAALKFLYYIVMTNQKVLISLIKKDGKVMENCQIQQHEQKWRSKFNPIAWFENHSKSAILRDRLDHLNSKWKTLLEQTLFLEPSEFSRLLAQRWEMKDNARLTDAESEVIQALKLKFNLLDK